MKRLVTSPVFMDMFAVAAAGLIAVYVYLYQAQQNQSSSALMVPDVQIGGPFELTDHNGKPTTNETFAGQYMLVYFGYSFCPDVCPTDLQVMGEATLLMEDEAPEKASKVTPIFITVDPARDTPSEMGEYVQNFHNRMVGLTGPLDKIGEVAKAYRVYYTKGDADEDGDYVMNHSAFTYLMGPDGNFLSMFKHGSSPADMAKDVLSLVN